jgi:hypothetical protein
MAGQSEVAGIGLHHDQPFAEAGPKGAGPTSVGLDGDHPRPSAQQRLGDRAKPGAHVEHGGSGADRGVSDEASGPLAIELVPAPPR